MRTWVKSVGLALAATLVAAGGASADKGDVFVGTFKDDKKPIVVFAFESATSPKDAMAVYVEPTYDQKIGAKFDPVKACRFTFDFADSPIPVNYIDKAIYGPSSGQKTVAYPDLPTFFTQKAMKLLVERNHVKIKTPKFSYYSSCIGFVWALSLSKTGDQWKEILIKNKLAKPSDFKNKDKKKDAKKKE